MLSPLLRKVFLTTHITLSVGWLGAVAAFLAIALMGLVSQDTMQVRSAYITMEWVGWFVIVPACLGSLATGLIQSLGTNWGLFRHKWIVVKLLMTVACTILLFLHMQPISYLADVASNADISTIELRKLRIQLITDAGAALLVLLVITSISVFKPWGRTRFSFGKQTINITKGKGNKPWRLYIIYGLISLIILLFIIFHLYTGGIKHF
ncbi:hypothetical protein I5M27_02640 [Adhaeribacter sp. BT258]|uniref:DUF2269 domain-containing protein n=1 Tax=Adhaeribacter terrigena TaxID=2793070 RepID=A0ABS1BXS3_9BACT|nr:hypothetical protein [Adhaeribacter terrigena]MBK0401864.1 hypothetical protein [Adhaeribacter terrigena]